MTISKNLWKVAALLLVMCLISAAMISGTFAKYSDTYAGEDTALVAKWEVTGTGGGFNTSGGGVTLDLFSHAYDVNIATGLSDDLIAPGVAGDFVLTFVNSSDVAAMVDFTIATTGSALNVPIKYGFTTGAGINLDAAQLATALDSEFANIAVGNPSTTVTKTVYWSWPFFVNDTLDAADTAIGTSSAAINRSTYGLTITASAIQKAPTE